MHIAFRKLVQENYTFHTCLIQTPVSPADLAVSVVTHRGITCWTVQYLTRILNGSGSAHDQYKAAIVAKNGEVWLLVRNLQSVD